MFIIQLVVPNKHIGIEAVEPNPYMYTFYIIAATMFINGVMSAARKSIGFCYIVELAPKKF